ncbi:hypothetical protein IQ07DRAFT_647645 [Pyrenochaeta sp. DS3sAY3a]|nr:hypothetical protein IQ07DRAFT_647645 [Pyrenochaeta sp. DS3sAY3a]
MAAPDHTAQFQEPPVAEIIPTKSTVEAQDTSAQFQGKYSRSLVEPISPHASASATSDGIDTTAGATDKSTTTKLKEAIKKPFVKEKETPPELQAAIEVMEARKEETARKMEAQGKDSSVLSGKRTDLIK